MKHKRGLIALSLLGLVLPFALSIASAATEPDYGSVAAFRARWVSQDALVGTPGINRPYTWGPNVPGAPATLAEPYADSPGGTRRVLYLDKARMEINNPATGYVTTGLAVKELVSGLRQDGDTLFAPLAPSQTQVAGDPVSVNPDTPVYASFQNVVTLGNADAHSQPNAVGAPINAFIAKNGAVSTITPPVNLAIGAYEVQTGHNIAAPFEAFKYQSGPVTDPATNSTLPNQPLYTTNPTSNVFGLAISEPYWVTTKIAGVDRIVLVQLFERRVLTYNPALPVNSVEMGNLGQHYYQWRYVESVSTPTTTPVSTTPASTTPVSTTPATTTAAPPAVGNFAGNWNTNFATMGLNQSGNSVVGSYQRYGEATVYAIHGTVTGNTLNGYYGANTSNHLTFTLGSGHTFTGNWGGSVQWCGVKQGSGNLPNGCGFSGSWSTNFASMSLTQNAGSVTGSYTQYSSGGSIAINGTIDGGGGVPTLNGYWGSSPSNTLNFYLNSAGNGFDGKWGTNHQWCGVRSGNLPDGCGWSGDWVLSGAGTSAHLTQNGNSVSGSYVNGSNGTVSGTIGGGAWTLNGTWHIGVGSGSFRWVQVNQGTTPQQFRGHYGTNTPWCGYRSGGSVPSPCSDV